MVTLLIAFIIASTLTLIILIITIINLEKKTDEFKILRFKILVEKGFIAMFFSVFLFTLIVLESKIKVFLYDITCSKEQKKLQQVTCYRDGIEVIYNDGNIKYEFLFEDKNST